MKQLPSGPPAQPASGSVSMTAVLQVVDDDGNYQEQAVQTFLRNQQLDAAGINYQIIAIMGPQSSGKSTLMNAVVRPHPTPPSFLYSAPA